MKRTWSPERAERRWRLGRWDGEVGGRRRWVERWVRRRVRIEWAEWMKVERRSCVVGLESGGGAGRGGAVSCRMSFFETCGCLFNDLEFCLFVWVGGCVVGVGWKRGEGR